MKASSLRTAAALILLAASVSASAAVSAGEAAAKALSPVRTIYGDLSGIAENGMIAFLGIPYAKAPVGELRWMPPVRPDAWKGVRKADSFGSRCLQNRDLGSFAAPGGSEDCLYLNVYTDENADRSKKRPVFVWIHGGALLTGAGSDYNPEFLVREGGAVAVTFNYRLGSLGFLSVPALNREKKTAAVNYGYMDQTAVLVWVKENIAAFGGDPDNITIAGESSGGDSVFSQMVTPFAKGLFHHAIVMSGGNVVNRFPGTGAPMNAKTAEGLGKKMAAALGCREDDTACLRAVPAETVLAKQTPYIAQAQLIDEKFIPMHYAEAFARGRFNRVTFIQGSNRDEGDFFSANVEELTGAPISDAMYPALVQRLFRALGSDVAFTEEELQASDQLTAAALQAYPLSSYLNAGEAFSAAAGDSLFSCSALHANALLSRYIPVYAYEFADRTSPSYVPQTSFPMRAAHTHEIPYLFRGFHGGTSESTELNAAQRELSRKMVQVWTHPEKAAQIFPDWHPFDPAKENFMTFALPAAKERSGEFSREHKCGMWQKAGLLY